MKIKLSICSLLMGIAFFSNTSIAQNQNTSPPINNQKFLKDYQNIVNGIIKEYNNNELDAHIFDINEKHLFNFLVSSSNYRKPGESDIMGMQYYNSFKVRGKETSFCFILYDSKSKLIENYLSWSKLNLSETTEYLALHEMGHCLVMNRLIKNGKSTQDKRQQERFADKFVLQLLYQTGNNSLIQKVLYQNSIQKYEDIHYNYNELKSYLEHITEQNLKFENFEKIIEYITNE